LDYQVLFNALTSPLTSLVTFGLGLLLGNWLAIGRDRRTEFNEVAQTLRESLPSPVEIDALHQRLRWWDRKRFSIALTRYIESRKKWKQNKSGDTFYDEETSAAILSNLKSLMSYTIPR
jgi:hypothetical protein